ncbi:MAG: helix-turn-helix transcriptional regulator [Caldilineaceae bacterium]
MLQFEHADHWYKLVKSSPTPNRQPVLSQREQEIIDLVSTGHSDKAIARELAISPHTVNTHVRRIFGKLGVSSRAEMIAYALQAGMVSASDYP